MSKHLVVPVVGVSAALVASLALASSAQAEQSAASAPRAKTGSPIVAGSLSTATMQEALNLAWLDKVAKDTAAAQAAAQARAAAAAQVAAQATTSTPVAASTSPAAAASGASGDVSSWANSGKSQSVKQCESGGNYSTNTGNGYYGAWQFDLPSWHANGGGAYAARPDLAPAWAQDQVAYNYYQRAGWGPWGCG